MLKTLGRPWLLLSRKIDIDTGQHGLRYLGVVERAGNPVSLALDRRRGLGTLVAGQEIVADASRRSQFGAEGAHVSSRPAVSFTQRRTSVLVSPATAQTCQLLSGGVFDRAAMRSRSSGQPTERVKACTHC